MGLFGTGGGRTRDEAALREELTRLDALDLDELADEVLARVFGPGGQMKDGLVPLWRVVMPFDPRGTGMFPGMPKEVRVAFQELVEEGLQRLEHRGLVYVRIHGRDQTDVELRLTRAGRETLGVADHG